MNDRNLLNLFSYTRNVNNQLLELLECCLISKKLLSNNDLEGYLGIALGLGLERLGINNSQKNVLLQIVLRDLNKTLLHNEANIIYTEIYSKIHSGTQGYSI